MSGVCILGGDQIISRGPCLEAGTGYLRGPCLVAGPGYFQVTFLEAETRLYQRSVSGGEDHYNFRGLVAGTRLFLSVSDDGNQIISGGRVWLRGSDYFRGP
jgi:hypothetical protein